MIKLGLEIKETIFLEVTLIIGVMSYIQLRKF